MASKTPIKMLHDRVLVEVDREAGERRSSGGIVIPATAAMGARRLAWSRVVAVGPHARAVEVGDRVLFDPEDKSEVEVHGETLRRDARARRARRRRRAARRRVHRPLSLIQVVDRVEQVALVVEVDRYVVRQLASLPLALP